MLMCRCVYVCIRVQVHINAYMFAYVLYGRYMYVDEYMHVHTSTCASLIKPI